MARDAFELLKVENPTVIADTGYYNGTEIKNCIDDGMSVYIKKAKANVPRIMDLKKFSYDKWTYYTVSGT